ncbi:hypothetical protein ACYFX5_16005 [Bremerella sp. T1]|uniref:hypothetical protein n=1 Tax=Bremerella sp. TYQ1 TaxID=3119568 RepID=UPI001CCCBC69|nr:hypothetical protein [Bremerella volcania]UBM34561.1 hypothetical protein LA756_17955 [Bremerella volcania]
MIAVRSGLVAILLCCSTWAVGAAELPEKAPIGDNVLRAFHGALDQKQYDLAEIIARGVLAKHGEENEFGQVMLTEIDAVEKHNEGPRLTSKYLTETKVYNVADELGVEDFNTKAKKLIQDATKEIGPRWQIHNCSAAPFTTNLSLVVSAPGFLHQEFAEYIRRPAVKAELK